MCQKIGLNTVINNAFSESVVRYSTEEYGHKQPFYFFLPELIKGFLPYSIFFPVTFVYLFSKKVERIMEIVGGSQYGLSPSLSLCPSRGVKAPAISFPCIRRWRS